MLRKRSGLRLLLCMVLCGAFLLLSPTGAASASFPDLDDHWARETLERAYEAGLVAPYPSNLMRPDEAMRKAEVLTALTRLIGTVPPAALTDSGISPDDPSYALAAQALALKLLPAEALTGLDTPISRGEAFTCIAQAFQLPAARQDTAILAQYQDADALSSEARPAVAALLEQGYVHGYNSLLSPAAPISRAEFFAILERIVALQPVASDFDLRNLDGGGVSLPARAAQQSDGAISLSALELHGDLLLRADAQSLHLFNVNADGRILLRSAKLDSLHMSGGSLTQIIIAASEGDVTFAPQNDGTVETLTVGEGGGILRLGDGIRTVEITGSDRTVFLDMRQLERLAVSGSNNRIVVAGGCHIGETALLFAGSDNTLTLDGTADRLDIQGDRTVADGKGTVKELLIQGIDCRVNLRADLRSELPDYGLGNTAITLKPSHKSLPAGERLSVSAAFSEVAGECAVYARWFQDGVASETYQNAAFLLQESAASEFFPNVSYSEGMAAATVVGLELRYQRGDVWQRVYTEVKIALENYPDEYYHPPGPSAGDKLIALTFDDGPSKYTAQLLDTLAQREVKVTFFVLGSQARRYPDLLTRMAEEGHEIGSHTYNHPDLPKLSSEKIRSEFTSTADAIRDAAGVTPTLMRPPYGTHNQTVRTIAAEKGLRIICWSVDTEDWRSRKADVILKRLFPNGTAAVRNGDIVLMHDIVPASVEAAGTVVDRLLAEGYQFVTVSELLALRYPDGAPAGKVYYYGR